MRIKSNSYFKIPFGEIQYGHLSKSIYIWIFGKRLRVWRGSLSIYPENKKLCKECQEVE